MKKAALIALLMLLVLVVYPLTGAGGTVSQEEANIAAVKRVLEVFKSRDAAVLDQEMAEWMAKRAKPAFKKMWAKGNVEADIFTIFAGKDQVAVNFTLQEFAGDTRGVEWVLRFVTIWHFRDGKIIDIQGGSKLLGELMDPGFATQATLPGFYLGILKNTIGDMRSISLAVRVYKEKNPMPKLDSIKKLAGVVAPGYIRILPLRDTWGNYFFFKSDGKNYWLGSGGSDGKFKGFDQKGTWDRKVDKGRDIILKNHQFVYGPDFDYPWLKKDPKTFTGRVFDTMGSMKTALVAVSVYREKNGGKAPQVESYKELAEMLQPKYVRGLSSKDAWGNDLIYKYDKKNPENYWIASSGSDGKFAGFQQQGKSDGEKDLGQDIIGANGRFVYYPDLEILKKK